MIQDVGRPTLYSRPWGSGGYSAPVSRVIQVGRVWVKGPQTATLLSRPPPPTKVGTGPAGVTTGDSDPLSCRGRGSKGSWSRPSCLGGSLEVKRDGSEVRDTTQTEHGGGCVKGFRSPGGSPLCGPLDLDNLF